MRLDRHEVKDLMDQNVMRVMDEVDAVAGCGDLGEMAGSSCKVGRRGGCILFLRFQGYVEDPFLRA